MNGVGAATGGAVYVYQVQPIRGLPPTNDGTADWIPWKNV
jgi:hypothetical protein